MQPLMECVPNFSEGRRKEVVTAIVQVMAQVPQVRVLDVHSDPDHNRSVVTLVGPPQPLAEAAFRGIAEAAKRINLEEHQGQHPFIGAADVVPFVPLTHTTMEEAVALARQLAQRVARELQLPVYLYGYAALRPERQDLAHIRRGGYARLKREIATHPERYPDFGPRALGPAGAVVIGARDFLIAFNVYLNTQDVQVARAIARALRHSSGGLRYVKALGMCVAGRAQVSMNLTDFRRTPLPRVMELLRAEAARYGTSVHHSELVGMIPQEALWEAARWYLQLDDFHPEQVLEPRVQRAFFSPTEDILHRLTQQGPGPGLVSLLGYTGALAAALTEKLARTLGSAGREAREQARQLRQAFQQAAEADAAALQAHWAVVRQWPGPEQPLPPALQEGPKRVLALVKQLEAVVEQLLPQLAPAPRVDGQGLLLLLQGLRTTLQACFSQPGSPPTPESPGV